jgi:hypothetical protein
MGESRLASKDSLVPERRTRCRHPEHTDQHMAFRRLYATCQECGLRWEISGCATVDTRGDLPTDHMGLSVFNFIGSCGCPVRAVLPRGTLTYTLRVVPAPPHQA